MRLPRMFRRRFHVDIPDVEESERTLDEIAEVRRQQEEIYQKVERIEWLRLQREMLRRRGT